MQVSRGNCWLGMATLIAVLLVTPYALAASEVWVSATPTGEPTIKEVGTQTAPTWSVNRSDRAGLNLVLQCDGFALKPVQTKGGEFIELSWPDAAAHGEVGTPALPVFRKLFVAPAGATVSVDATAGNPVVVDLTEAGIARVVKPVQAPIPKLPGAKKTAAFAYDAEAYRADVAQPAKRAMVEELGTSRGQRLFAVEVYPIAYNPVAGQVLYYPQIELQISFDGGDGFASVRTPLKGMASTILNPEALPAAARYNDNYLIIVAGQFADDIADFATFKAGQGFNVTTYVVAPGTGASAIKSYIQGLWGGVSEPGYILLVGDTDTIPSWTGGGTGSPATDIQYACMDAGDDWHPDIAIGRFSVRTADELAAVVEKTIDLESGAWGDPAYAERACFMASVDHYEISEGTHDYVIDTHLDPAGLTSDRLYQVTYGATTQDVRDSFNDGRVYGIYSGHGGTYSWADGPPFSQDDVRDLTNYQMYPFVCSFACITGTYTVDECFTETWLRVAGKGAATIYGSSVNSYWTEDDWLERDLFDAIYDAENPIREVSPAWQTAFVRYLEHGGETGTTRRYYEMYNLMGDPSLHLPEIGGGADLRVTPTGGLSTEGMAGGPFDPDTKVYTVGNNSDAELDYTASTSATWVEITNGSGTLPAGGEVEVTVSLGAEAYTLGQGHYEATVAFVNETTHDGDTERSVVLDVGRTIIEVGPGYGLETGGPTGGPFTGSVTYTVTSARPTPVEVEVSASADWISLNGEVGPLTFTLSGTGATQEVVVGIGSAAESLDTGLYTGEVTFTNVTSGEGDTARAVLLEVGRVLYTPTDVPQGIEDYETIESTLTVLDAYCVGDVNVDLDLTHTYIGDLTVDLISPSGVTVRLHDRSGGSTDDIVTTYDEQGGTMPDGPGSLADFADGGVAGTWTLRVEDHAGGDQGSLNDWALRIVPLGDACPPRAYDVSVTIPAIVASEIALDGESLMEEPLTYIVTSLPSHGALLDPAGGAIESVPYALADGGSVVVLNPDDAYQGDDSFTYMVNDGQDSTEATVSVMIGGPQSVYVFMLDEDPGWETEGQWAFGVPTGQGSHAGDPTSGHTGENVYGYNLNGDYPSGMPEYTLTSTALDCSELSHVEVRFWRWLGVEQASYDHAKFQVSDNGITWVTIWENESGWENSLDESAWTQHSYDISAQADHRPTVYLRWVMGTTDGSVEYHGWNIDDVEVWGVAPLAGALLTRSASVGWHEASGGYAGGEQWLAIDPVVGLIEPRETTGGGVWLSLTFDADVSAEAVVVSMAPDPGVSYSVVAGATSDVVEVRFAGAVPRGAYEVTVEVSGAMAGGFPVCYVAGDVNCSGDATGLDLAAIQSPGNWNRDLSAGASPRADVNRDGQVSGLDLARVQSPANWNQPVPPLGCGCP